MEDELTVRRRRRHRIAAVLLAGALALFGGALLVTPAEVAAAPSEVTVDGGPVAQRPPHPAGIVGVVLCRVFRIGCPGPTTTTASPW